nr:alpha/beta fold hydrolase [Solirubrobacterales bacterium]
MPQIDVNDTRLHFIDEGPRDAPALLLSHSLFLDSTMFDGLSERLAGELRVVRYDHRGQGASRRAPAGELGMDTLTEDAAALVEELELPSCHVAGNSMGGFVALRLAARRPDLILSCAILGSSGEPERRGAGLEPLVAHLREHGTDAVVDSVMQMMFGDTFLADAARAGEREHWRGRILALDHPAIGDAAHHVVARKGVLGELGSTDVPILAVAGEEDHVSAAELSANVAEATPNGRFEVVARAGHSLALEEPEAVAALL